MGIGTNILGYGNDEVDSAVIETVKKGNMSTLNCPEEVFLAEKLMEINPWADMVRFARSGGEANSIAIRIARASSGKDNVAICGYHGWHDWYLSANHNGGDDLKALASIIEADSRVSSTNDWETAHEAVERDGGLIFGTPGLLSLQFVVASIAAVASAFVFLSLVLTQRQKELAILQAIGASPNQIIRLVLFEILSIVLVSMLLGIILGIGVAFSFNGFFDVFGFIFQIFGGTSTVIERELVYPWVQLGLVTFSVFVAVVLALIVTTRRALSADLASVLKGE